MNESNNNTRTVVVQVGIDEQVSVSKKTKAGPNYYRVGNGTMNKDKIKSMDLLQEIADATKSGQYLILAIKNGITYDTDYNPVVKVVGKSKYEQDMISAGYKELLARDLVVRVKRSYYMLNPNALIPLDYTAAIKVWDEAKARVAAKGNKTPTP